MYISIQIKPLLDIAFKNKRQNIVAKFADRNKSLNSAFTCFIEHMALNLTKKYSTVV